jgi:hypothetical protein
MSHYNIIRWNDKHLLFECLPPLDLLLTVDSDFFKPAGLDCFLDEARDPAFNLPTVNVTLPIDVYK